MEQYSERQPGLHLMLLIRSKAAFTLSTDHGHGDNVAKESAMAAGVPTSPRTHPRAVDNGLQSESEATAQKEG
jgi:hypothetical protein